MIVEKKKVVTITYQLKQDGSDGEVIETASQDNPLISILGIGSLLSSFEDKLFGLSEGQEFDFTLTAAEAYGDYNENVVVSLPIDTFIVDGKLQDEMLYEGNSIPMLDEQGNKLTGMITSVEKEHVVMDFNHPLAGKSLHFHGTVLNVRDATSSELDHGHVHE